MRIVWSVIVSAFAVIGIIGCGSSDRSSPVADTATSGAFELAADESLRPAIDSLVSAFNASMPNAKVAVKYMNAATALDAVLQHKSRLALIGRPLNEREHHILDSAKIDLPEFDVALDAIAAITSKSNSRNSISLDSLRLIVEGKADIRYYSTSYLSSTEGILDSLFGYHSTTLSGRIKRFQTSDSVVAAVQADPSSVGFISSVWMNHIQAMGDSSVKSLRISSQQNPIPIQLHLAYIYQGTYPLVSRVCGYTSEQPNTLPRGFLAYVMTSGGQRVCMNFDLLPRTQIIKIVPAQ